MEERIQEELGLLRSYISGIEVDSTNSWVLVRGYKLPSEIGWSREAIDLCFEIPPGYPNAKPYGFYVPNDLTCEGQHPNSWKQNPNKKPPFEGAWGFISWGPKEEWEPKGDIQSGSNLLTFYLSFKDRFEEGR